MKRTRVLFVCLGNICRSPSAEAVMAHYVSSEGLSDHIQCDSAGTSAHHQNETADPRSIEHARRRGFSVTSRSRQFNSSSDFRDFDYIISMDDNNFRNIQKLDTSGDFSHKLFKMVDFQVGENYTSVPDPYYDGESQFELVLDILEECCRRLLDKIKQDCDFK